MKNIIPGLEDSIGSAVEFERHEFKILSSDLSNKTSHKVAIVYYTDWVDFLGLTANYLIVGNSRADEGKISSLTIPLRENLSIVEWDIETNSKLDNVKHEGERHDDNINSQFFPQRKFLQGLPMRSDSESM